MSNFNSDRKIKVLIASHIGKPVGGISINYESLLKSSLNEKVRLSFVETSGGTLSFEERGRWGIINYWNAIKNILSFTRSVIKTDPDIVHIGTAYNPSFAKHSVMVLIARLLRKRVILHLHCGFQRFFQISPLGKKWALWIFRQCQGIIIISKEWIGLQQLIPGVKIAYIPNSIRTAKYVDISRTKNSSRGNPIEILYMGHLGREKGIFDLLQAADILRKKTNISFHINLVGEALKPGEINQLFDVINQLSLNHVVKIHPAEYNHDKIFRFANSDIFILPSYHEGMPISIIEAMASGMPVIATNVGGIPDMVKDGKTGLLVNPGQPGQLADKILVLLENSEEIIRMGINGRKNSIEFYDIEKRVDRIMDFYNNIVNN